MNLLFWNIQKKHTLYPIIVKAVIENNVDVFGLAEFYGGKKADTNTFLDLLNATSHDKYKCLGSHKKVYVFAKDKVSLLPKYDGSRVEFYELSENGTVITLAFCHLPSKFASNDSNQIIEAQEFAEEVLDYETSKAHHNRTIVCGDFNMNPFDECLMNVTGPNTTMNKYLATRGDRTYRKKGYTYFYNPMWNLLGTNDNHTASGTYVLKNGKPICYHWHMLDQVLLRPSVVSNFDISKLRIVTKIDNNNLISQDCCIPDDYSDHLPILYSLNF